MMTRRIVLRGIGAAMLLCTSMFASTSWAAYPAEKPIRLVVPLPAGSATDAVARLLAQHASDKLGQQIIIDNKAGADGAIAAREVLRAEPDGYTLFLATNSPMSVVPALRKTVPYDVEKDFTPITDLGRFTLFLVVNEDLPVKTLQELIDYAKKKPGELSYASGNTAGFVAMAQIKALADIDMVHVPYKGEPAAIVDLIGKRVDLMFSNLTTALPHIESGKLRPLTLTLSTRSPALPDVPTVAESGLEGFSITSWNALFGPAGMPRDVVDKLNKVFAEVLAEPEVISTLAKQGIPVHASTPEELAELVRTQLKAYTEVIKAAGMQID